MNLKIHKDGSLKMAYGWLSIICLIVSFVLYLAGNDDYLSALFGSGLLLLLLLPQLDPRPTLVIDEYGIKKRGKIAKWDKSARWNDIEELRFEKKKFENSSWISFTIRTKNNAKPIEFILKRMTAEPKELFDKLVEYCENADYDIKTIGLGQWDEEEIEETDKSFWKTSKKKKKYRK